MSASKQTKLTTSQHMCFVVGPIGKDGSEERKHSDLLLHAVIKEVLEAEEFGYAVKRADEDADPGMIGDRVVTDIIRAELVVADLTGLNPNAFYELGIRHSTEKPTIHIAKSGTLLPFDNVSHRTIFVDLTAWDSIKHARERLATSARAIKELNYRVSNPITQANASFKMRESEDPRDQVITALQDRVSALENAATRPAHTINSHPQLRDSKIQGLIDYAQKLSDQRVGPKMMEASLRSFAKNSLSLETMAFKPDAIELEFPDRVYEVAIRSFRE